MKMIPEYILKADKVARQTFINFNILEWFCLFLIICTYLNVDIETILI